MRGTARARALIVAAVVALGAATFLALSFAASGDPALAQPRHPFAIGAQEGGGSASGVSGWLLDRQSQFHRRLSGGVRAVKESPAALWTLIGLAFAYGVLHAAGPGHGKAVIGSYMVANERAFARGSLIALGAAALQGVVAFAIVGVGAILLGARAQQMSAAAALIEQASYAAVLALGLWLSWRKGRAFLSAWRGEEAACADCGAIGPRMALSYTPSAGAAASAVAVGAPRVSCGHMPDAAAMGRELSWRAAATTLVAAGARPCSGAIVVLVFALSQGVFWAGGLAVAAMSLGTALTTSALAGFAVLFKSAARRLARSGGEGRVALALRGVELAAALALALLGAALLAGFAATPGGA